MRSLTRPSLVVMCMLFVVSCATVRPCPPPEVITVEKPVVVPWPNPPLIPPPDLQLSSISVSGATVPQLLLAMLHDMDEWKRVAQQAMEALKVYEKAPSPPR